MSKWFWIAIVAVTVSAGAYLYSPYVAAQSLMKAARNADRDGIEDRVDFPKVRQHMKDQVSSALLQKMSNDPSIQGNPFAQLGAALVPALTDRLVDTFVTPDGLSRMLQSAKASAAAPALAARSAPMTVPRQTPAASSPSTANGTSGQSPSAATESGPDVTMRYGTTLDHFYVTVKNRYDPTAKIDFEFGRHGLINWKLERIELPIDQILSNSPSDAPASQRAQSPQAAEPGWSVQIGLFAQRANAERMAQAVRSKGFGDIQIDQGANGIYQVRVADLDSEGSALTEQRLLMEDGFPAAVIAPSKSTEHLARNYTAPASKLSSNVMNGASDNSSQQREAALAQYQSMIASRVERAWIRPPNAQAGINCQVRITQVPGGVVTAVQVGSCNGDDTVRHSISDAAYRASPLPAPSDPALFDPDIVVTFAPRD